MMLEDLSLKVNHGGMATKCRYLQPINVEFQNPAEDENPRRFSPSDNSAH